MRPAYFPTILGGLLIAIGVISVIRSFVVPRHADRTRSRSKGLVLVTAFRLSFLGLSYAVWAWLMSRCPVAHYR